MTACVVCSEREADPGYLTCQRCGARLGAGLRQVAGDVAELAGRRLEVDSHAWDPVSAVLPAGPVAGAAGGPRATGTRERSLPIAVDPTDLLLPVNHGARALQARGALGLDDDQVGYVSTATVLDWWAQEWAARRGEHIPRVWTVAALSGWLLLRLPWALEVHPRLAEFAEQLDDLRSALWAACGKGAARPKLMHAPCPGCGLLTLTQAFPEDYIDCGHCGRCISPLEYEEMVMELRHEVTAVDVLTVLNGLTPVALDKLRFAVVTETDQVDFPLGEVMVLAPNGREPLGDGRSPAKWSVTVEEFKRLADAVARREELLKPCPTCSGPARETVGMVCQTCGTDYAAGSS